MTLEDMGALAELAERRESVLQVNTIAAMASRIYAAELVSSPARVLDDRAVSGLKDSAIETAVDIWNRVNAGLEPIEDDVRPEPVGLGDFPPDGVR